MPKTLLLADDSVTIQKVVGITFANEDVELVTAPNGDDALRRARDLKPDLVMADIGMPGLDGYELCAAIRADSEIASTPVLLLTGTFETYDEERATEVGASAYIAKPFEAQALIDQVFALLNGTIPTPAPTSGLASEAAEDTPEQPAMAMGAPADRSELPRAEAPELLPNPSAQTPPSSQKGLSFEDLDFNDAPVETGSSTQILGAAPPLAVSLPPAAAPDLDGSDFPAAEAGMGSEPVAEGIDTEHGIDQYNETAFLDPMAEPPTRPDPVRVPMPGAPSEAIDPFRAAPSGPSAADPATFADFGEIAGPPVTMPEPEPDVLDAPEVLPEAEPIDITPPSHPFGAPSVVDAVRAEDGPGSAAQAPKIDQEAISSAVEKVAWEAFGNLSEQLVREIVKKVEGIAWEVVPQLAERMLQEEIEKLKRESD
jgi:CheY-like chemotaxis protein